MIEGSTSQRYSNAQEYGSGEVVIATCWLIFFLLIVGSTLLSEPLSSTIALAARY